MADEEKKLVIENGVLVKCKDNAEKIIIPDDVTAIGDKAFWDCSNLSSVTIPGSVTVIGEKAFWCCMKLSSIMIPKSVKEIGNDAFSYCALVSLVLPSGVTRIGENAFYGCSALRSVTIPETVRYIDCGAFSGCESLSTICYGGTKAQWNAVKKGRFWHRYSSAATVECTDGVLELPVFDIENSVLVSYNSRGTSAVIPDGVTAIGESAFYFCEQLTSVVIPDGVTEIGDNAFSHTGLKSLQLPSSVRKIGSYAFVWCPFTSVEIPDGVEEIGDHAFLCCIPLISISFPASVKKIGSFLFSAPDFCSCLSLEKIRYNGTKQQWAEIEKGTDWNATVPATELVCTDGSIELQPFKIEGYVFVRYSGKASSFSIPEGIKKIDGFHDEDICYTGFSECKTLKSVKLPSSLTDIGDVAFARCTELKSVELPSGLEFIGWQAFEKCTSLSEINYGGTKAQWNAVFKKQDWRRNIAATGVHCSDGMAEFETFDISNGVLTGYYGTDSDIEVVIPDDVTHIDEHIFQWHISLESVKIPASVKSIGSFAFDRCKSLKAINIPDGVSMIGDYAFSGCESLADFRFGGTKAQWAAVVKGIEWHEDVPAKCVVCTDGTVEL